MGHIYKIENKINGQIYIGQTIKTVEKRFQQHKNNSNKSYFSQIVLYKAFNKYGIENFECNEIEEVPNELNVDEYINPIPSVDQFEQIAKDYMEQANDENIKSCHVSNYFGTYEGAVIVKFKKEYYNNDFGGFDDIIRIEVDDVVIEDCYGDNAYNVWKDGRFYSLHLAYDDGFGFLTKQDMIVLATIIGENKSIDLANS